MDTEYIIKVYHETKNTVKTARICRCHHRDVARILRENKVEVYGNRIYEFDYEFFDKIDTEAKAYFLGFLWADGNNSGHGTITLKISSKDEEILKIFNKEIKSSRPLKSITNIKCTDKNGILHLCKDATLLSLSHKKFANHLSEIGLVKNKTFTLELPKNNFIPEKFISHFIRGYFDGDGSISKRLQKKRKRFTFTLEISMKNKKIAESISDILYKYGIKNKIRSSGSIYKINISTYEDKINFKKWLYNNSLIFLNRKRQIFEELELIYNEYKSKKTSNIKGISSRDGKFVVRKYFDKKIHHLGVFKTKEEAINCLNDHAISKA